MYLSEMSCLLAALYDKTVRLKPDCRKMLDERVTMWEYAARVSHWFILSVVQDHKYSTTFCGIKYTYVNINIVAAHPQLNFVLLDSVSWANDCVYNVTLASDSFEG